MSGLEETWIIYDGAGFRVLRVAPGPDHLRAVLVSLVRHYGVSGVLDCLEEVVGNVALWRVYTAKKRGGYDAENNEGQ